MTRFKQASILSFLLMLLAMSSYAQFNIGGGLAFNNYKGEGYKRAHTAVQLRLGYDGKDKGYFFNAGYNLSPAKGKTNIYFEMADPNNNNELTEYFIQQQIKINNAFIHFGYALFPVENDFHIRLIGGGSMDFINISYTFDENLPAIFPKSAFGDTTMTGLKVDFGVGADFRLGNGKLFAELMFAMPANTVNGMPYANPTVGHRGVIIGYSYLFGSRRDYW